MKSVLRSTGERYGERSLPPIQQFFHTFPWTMESVFQFLFKYRLFLFQKGHLTFESSVSPWSMLFLGLGVVSYSAFLYFRPSVSKAQRTLRRGVLVTARVLIFLLILFALLRPALHVSTLLPRQHMAVLLIDNSKSMSIPDAGVQTRIDAVKHLLDPSQSSFLPDLEKRFRIQLCTFSRGAKKLDSLEGLQAEGTGTSLEAALEDILREFESYPLAGLIILTDGADNLSKNLQPILGRYQAHNIPIHVVAIGEPEIKKDIEVMQASAPQKILPGSITTATVSLKNHGYSGENVVLEVREEGKLVHSKAVTLARNNEAQTVEINIAPKGKGLKSYTVSVPPQANETLILNNSQNLVINVEDTKPKILYLEGTPRWEFKFIREALQPDKNIQLMSLLRTSGNKFYRQGVESEGNLAAGFPVSKEELFQYKGLILGSVEASFFSSEQLKMVSDFVSERGGGFLMLGGKHSFDEGKYANTPIADLLPVVLGQRESGKSFVTEPVRFRLTPYGRTHLVTRLSLDENENEKRWNSLPSLGEFNWISAAKPGAIVLASGYETKGNVILLAAHRYGRGRAMAFTAANSWLWQMEMPHTDDSHEIFWRQTLRWLVGSAPDPVELEFDRGVVGADEPLHLSVEVNDDSFHKVNDAEVMTAITSPNGKTTDLPLRWIVKKDGGYSGEFKPADQGTYRVHVRAVRQDKEVGKTEGFFLVTDNHLEFYNAGQNKDLLRRITSETGGRYTTLAGAGNLPEEMTYTNRPNSLPQLLPLWDMPVVFMSLCLLLLLEWAGRRKQGLA